MKKDSRHKKDIRGVGTRVFQMEELKGTNDKLVKLLIIADVFLGIWGIAYLVLFIKQIKPWQVIIFFIVFFGIIIWISNIKYRNSKLIKDISVGKIGIQGEVDTFNKVKSLLPQSYAIFNDLRLAVGNRTSQIDQLIVGPNGIFSIEVKSYGGDIEVTSDGTLRRGSFHSEKERSQILHHEQVLKLQLDGLNIRDLDIKSALIFTRRAKSVKGSAKEFFVGYPEGVVKQILGYKAKSNLTDVEVREIVKKLSKVNRH